LCYVILIFFVVYNCHILCYIILIFFVVHNSHIFVVHNSHIFPPFQLRGKIITYKLFTVLFPYFPHFKAGDQIKSMILYFRRIIHISLCFYTARRLVRSLNDSPNDSLKETQYRFSFQIYIKTAYIIYFYATLLLKLIQHCYKTQHELTRQSKNLRRCQNQYKI
jgi:hypothetical protein